MIDIIGLAVGAVATFAGVFRYFDYLEDKLCDKIYLTEQKLLAEIKDLKRLIRELRNKENN